MSYCIYLRKSRKNLETESYGKGETLARHEHALLALAKSRSLPIGAIYREVVSGETIDQGIVQQAFTYSNTLIITPTKTYDPSNEFDKEYLPANKNIGNRLCLLANSTKKSNARRDTAFAAFPNGQFLCKYPVNLNRP